MKRCIKCGYETEKDVKFCLKCGNNMADVIFCAECGIELKDSQKFCPKCGSRNGFYTAEGQECIETAYINQDNDKHKLGKIEENNYKSNTEEKNKDSWHKNAMAKITGETVENYFSIKDLFKNGFAMRDKEDLDALFVCGDKATTPKIESINEKDIGAFAYLRVLLFLIISIVFLYVCITEFENTNAIPGFILLGAFAVPVACLIFIFELNVYRSIPLYAVLGYFIVGGCLSLVVTLFLFQDVEVSFDLIGVIKIGVIEEIGKIIPIYFICARNRKINRVLEGLLVGAAVGAGFAAFETAGYIFNYPEIKVMLLRALLAPGGHIAWAAVEGAGLMYIKGADNPISIKYLLDKKYITICLLPIAMHAFWDWYIGGSWPFYSKYILLIIGIWTVLFYFVNLGLKQLAIIKQCRISEKVKNFVS